MRNYSLKPRIVLQELGLYLGTGKTIFVGSMTDMFGPWNPTDWIDSILYRWCQHPKNTYLFQSKNPSRFHDFIEKFPPKTILGTTIETNKDYEKYSRAPSKFERSYALSHITNFIKEVTIEPIMEFDIIELTDLVCAVRPKFVAIGADSKGHNLPEPTGKKVEQLIKKLSTFTEVKVKKNLSRIFKEA